MQSIYYYFELLALLAAAFKYKTMLKTPYKVFLPFMVFIVFYETATLYNVFVVNKSNLWSFNIIAIIEFVFYTLFIRSICTSGAYRRFALGLTLAGLVYSVFSLFLISGFWRLNISAFILQTVIVIAIIGRYLWELLEVPFSNSLNLVKQPGFWLVTGVLFYYLGEVLFFSSFSYMAYKNNLDYFYLFLFISNLSNAILYSCLITCFLCLKPTRGSFQLL